MKVPFFDWKKLFEKDRDNILKVIENTLSKGAFILQSDVDDFEVKLAKISKIKYSVGISDCTNAILLGLRACNICPGDEIILPGHSFIAAAQSIHFAGAIPVPVEISEHDWLIDPQAIENAITPKTRAIMPVHVNGRLCQMELIKKIADKHGLLIFEDAAQALGAHVNGIYAGMLSEWAAFSFYPSKTLGCFGDAGGLVTNKLHLHDNIKSMRNHGANADKRIPIDTKIWGTNARLDNIHAAILAYKATKYSSYVARRREIAQKYHDALAGFTEVALPPHPNADPNQFDVFQNFEFCTPVRDTLREFLSKNGVGTIVQWGGFGIHQLEGLGLKASLPITDKFFQNSLLIPLNCEMDDDQVDYIIDILIEFYEKGGI